MALVAPWHHGIQALVISPCCSSLSTVYVGNYYGFRVSRVEGKDCHRSHLAYAGKRKIIIINFIIIMGDLIGQRHRTAAGMLTMYAGHLCPSNVAPAEVRPGLAL